MLPGIRTDTRCAALKMIICSLAMSVLSSRVVGCVRKTVDDRGEEKKMSAKTIEEVLKEHTDEWMSIPGVVGTAIGKAQGKPCIRVLAAEKTEGLINKIPSQVEGFPVVIEETGEIRALESD